MGTWDLKEPQCPPFGNSLEVLQTQSCPKEFVMVVPVMIIGLSKIEIQDPTSTRDPTPSDCPLGVMSCPRRICCDG